MGKTPKVSVCIASFNHADYLPQAIESILNQTFQDFEVIIVDDGSTDNSFELAERFSKSDPQRIRVFRHDDKKNHGIGPTFNRALSRSQGQYIAILGSDDLWYPEKLEIQTDALDQDPKISLVYSLAHLIDADFKLDRLRGKINAETIGADLTCQSNPFLLLHETGYIPALTVLFRRMCLNQTGLADESLIYNDWELWIRFLAHLDFGFCPHPLALYRVHQKNITEGYRPTLHLERIDAALSKLETKASQIGGKYKIPRNRGFLHLQRAFILTLLKRKPEAEQCLLAAFQIDPTLKKDRPFLTNWMERQKLNYGPVPSDCSGKMGALIYACEAAGIFKSGFSFAGIQIAWKSLRLDPFLFLNFCRAGA